jgi:long-chain acyl-CoA synthetase
LRRKEFGIWNRITWDEYGKMVKRTAAALIHAGLQPGDPVAILGDNRPEWLVCHVAAMAIGCVTCGVYSTNAPEQVAYVVGHSESKLLFVENEEQVDKVLQIYKDLAQLKKVVVWDSKGLWGFSHEGIMFWDEFLEQGDGHLKDYPTCVNERLDAIDPAQAAMMIYTSGTTGRPKGAMISHRNIISLTESLVQAVGFRADDELLSYLPLAHIYENFLSVFQAIYNGGTVNFVESIDTLPLNLREVSPTIFCSVPRIWEKFMSMIEIRMSDSTIVKRVLYRLAVKVGLRYVRTERNSSRRILWSLAYWPFYILVLYHLKRQLGLERVRYGVCGAAPASPELFEFYNALGVPLREGYGQTESTGVIAIQRIDNPRMGYMELLPDVDVKIAEDGEILARGGNVFQGYYKNPELTSETVKDGWLHTGDVGVLEDGHLKILDRKKDIIITAGGKNITPAFIENKLKFSSYIQDAVVIGDGRKFLTALILIDEDNVTKYAQDNRIPFTTFADLTQNEEVQKLINQEVIEMNKNLSKVETIKKFALLPRQFYEEDGDVTPTKKVKRASLEKRYAEMIDNLYKR